MHNGISDEIAVESGRSKPGELISLYIEPRRERNADHFNQLLAPDGTVKTISLMKHFIGGVGLFHNSPGCGILVMQCVVKTIININAFVRHGVDDLCIIAPGYHAPMLIERIMQS